jgi:hypothetical protein
VVGEGNLILTAYGATVVFMMMVFYALESRSPWFTFVFGVACLGSSLYGWLAGTWPFGVVEAVWAIVAFRKWVLLRGSVNGK